MAQLAVSSNTIENTDHAVYCDRRESVNGTVFAVVPPF